MDAIERLIKWLLVEARCLPNAEAVLNGLCPRLLKAGIPIWRLSFNLTQLHPQLAGSAYRWVKERGRAETNTFERTVFLRPIFYNSPMGLVYRMRCPLRWNLSDPVEAGEFPLLQELHDEGGTDYVVWPIFLANRTICGFSITTREEGGFTPDQVHAVERILPAMSALAEIFSGKLLTDGLLGAYVGQDTARQILEGRVTLGSTEAIDAVVVFCDLRGFTRYSETLDRRALVDLLNDYFGVVVGAVERAGGEILKYLGDGVLAIFPFSGADERAEACARGMIAALEGIAALEPLNTRRATVGAPPAHAGAALHVGTVLYGNIGTGSRLDFTVIGPAVNVASRLQSLCRDLGEPILTSETFAETSPVQLRDLGDHAVRGVSRPLRVFAPAHVAQVATA